MSFINSKTITPIIFALGAALVLVIWLADVGRYTQPTPDQKSAIARFFYAANPLSAEKIYSADIVAKVKEKYEQTKHPKLKAMAETLLSDKMKDRIKNYVVKSAKKAGYLATNLNGEKSTIELMIFDPFCSGDILQLADSNGTQQIAPGDQTISVSIAAAVKSGELRLTGIKDTHKNGISFAILSEEGAFLLPIIEEGQTISLRTN